MKKTFLYLFTLIGLMTSQAALATGIERVESCKLFYMGQKAMLQDVPLVLNGHKTALVGNFTINEPQEGLLLYVHVIVSLNPELSTKDMLILRAEINTFNDLFKTTKPDGTIETNEDAIGGEQLRGLIILSEKAPVSGVGFSTAFKNSRYNRDIHVNCEFKK